MKNPDAVAHINIIGFRAAVAALLDRELRNRPYVIAGGEGRGIVWDVSPEALRANIRPGMALAAAARLVRDLKVEAPNPAAYRKVNGTLEAIISRYAPLWQNDGAGNIYLDISGTRRLFGSPADCVSRVQNEISNELGMEAAAAAAANKLVSKVASRTIRPEGLVEVRPGDESAFLRHQDIVLLPGIGPSLLRTLRITGFREAGELAALSDGEAAMLLGKKGVLLRDAALGIDYSPVAPGNTNRTIKRRADFAGDTIDLELIRGALASLVESGGLELRNEKLGTSAFRLQAVYSDGAEAEGFQKSKRLLALDRELLAAFETLYKKTACRRIRLKSIGISFEGLLPLGYEVDLFEPESDHLISGQIPAIKSRKLQEAVDLIQNRYGSTSVMKGLAMAAYTFGKYTEKAQSNNKAPKAKECIIKINPAPRYLLI